MGKPGGVMEVERVRGGGVDELKEAGRGEEHGVIEKRGMKEKTSSQVIIHSA